MRRAAGKPGRKEGVGDRKRLRGRVFAYDLLPELIGYNLRQAQVAVFEDFAAEMAAFDITPGQFGVLCLIAANPGLNQSDLGAAMGVDRSTVVAAIDRMERRRWAARRPAPGDRRSYALELTPEGQRLLEELKPRVRAHERRIAAGLSEAEQRLLIDLLRRIALPPAGADETGDPPAAEVPGRLVPEAAEG